MKNLFDLKPLSCERCLNGMKKKTTILGWSSSADEFLMKFYEKKAMTELRLLAIFSLIPGIKFIVY